MTKPFWRILIVDDEEEIRTLLTLIFSSSGFHVTTASDGLAATLLTDTERFDVIMTDVNMPRMNGMQFALNAKQSSLNADALVFVLSGYANDEVVTKAASLGVVNVLPKPFDSTKIIKLVTDRLGDRTLRNNLDPMIVDCFAKAASELSSYYLGAEAVMSQVQALHEPLPSAYASGLVTLGGDGVVGFVGLSLSRALLLRFSQSLFKGADVALTDTFSADILGEMANQIAGRAKAHLAQRGLTVQIGLPQVILGGSHKIYHKTSGSTSHLEFHIGEDSYAVNFHLQSRQKVSV